MTKAKEIRLHHVVSTGNGILVAFDNGVEAFLDAPTLFRLVETGKTFLISEAGVKLQGDPRPFLPEVS